MSYKKLYDQIQTIKGKISVRVLRDFAIGFSSITRVREQWSSALDSAFMAGFYVEGPLGPPVPLAETEAMIVIGRDLAKNKHMRRFVYAKELMHVFDLAEEKVDSGEKLDRLAERFTDPSAELSPQFRSEHVAFWRALGVLCQEDRRRVFQKQLEAGQMTVEVVATAIQIPTVYARNLFRSDFADIVNKIMG